MKTLQSSFLTFLFTLCISFTLYSQDLIIQKNGPDINCIVLGVQDCDISYKQGETESVLSKGEIFMIIYSDGRKVDFMGVDLKHCKKTNVNAEGLKGPNGRRPFRQLGFPVLYREFQWEVDNAYRVGIYYSSGHIKETCFLGYLVEFGADVFHIGFPDDDGYNGSNDFVTGFLNVGLLYKIYKNEKWLVYAKTTGGVVAVGYFYKVDGGSYEYGDYVTEWNYNVAAGVNYKLGRKVGIFLEGGYSRVQVLMFGLSFMRQ